MVMGEICPEDVPRVVPACLDYCRTGWVQRLLGHPGPCWDGGGSKQPKFGVAGS